MSQTFSAFPISVVIPCKNEEESILVVLREIIQTLERAKIRFELIVVDNNSTDETASEAKKAGSLVRVVPCLIPGYGAAILAGIQKVKNTVVCMLDGDGSYHPKDIPLLLLRYARNHKPHTCAPLCMGNRFTHNKTKNMKFVHRVLGVPFLNGLTNTLYGSSQAIDSHCGLRLFHKGLIKELDVNHTDFSFANEMVCKALKRKLEIIEVPIVLRKDLRRKTTSKIKAIKDGFCALKTIFSIRFR